MLVSLSEEEDHVYNGSEKKIMLIYGNVSLDLFKS